MKPRRKTVLKTLKQWAEALPAETYKAYHKYNTPMKEPAEDGKMVWRMGSLSDHPVNHGRRLKKLYDLGGLAAVEQYIHSKGFQLSEKS